MRSRRYFDHPKAETARDTHPTAKPRLSGRGGLRRHDAAGGVRVWDRFGLTRTRALVAPLREITMIGDEDTLLDALERASPYIDAGHVRGAGMRPSSTIILRYCQLMTSGRDDAREHAQRLARDWLAEGRRRWRAGYSANPLPAAPVPRAA
jgi:hypothetical protein